jgi:N-methylhydantoinase A
MVGGILEMTIKRGIDPRQFLLVCGGGAGGIHGAKLAKELEMKKVVIPKTAPVMCSMGMLDCDVTFSYVGSKYTNTGNFDFDGVNALLADLEEKATAALEREGIEPEKRRFEYYVAARYPMQVSEIDMPLRKNRIDLDMIPQLVDDFHSIHRQRYAVSDKDSFVECTDWRVLGIGDMPRLKLQPQPFVGQDAFSALKGERSAYFEEPNEFVITPIYDGNKLGHGMRITGPAIIEDSLTTTVVIPDCRLTVDELGSYILELI